MFIIRRSNVQLILVLSLAAILTVLPLMSERASAQSPGDGVVRSITVVGEGKVSTRPGLAKATIGVEVASKSILEATAENRAVLTEVLEALKAQGIAEEDIQTAGFSIYAERFGSGGPLANDEITYRVMNNVAVKIRDLDNIGGVLDAAIEAGANNIHGVEFVLEDRAAAQSQAREKAIQNAQERAAEIAELAGVELGPILSLSEVIGMSGGFYAGMLSSSMGYGAGGNGTIAPGELEIAYQIEGVYSLSD